LIPILFILVFCVAILFSMLGLGGGILYVPIFLQAGLPFQEAAATSLSIIAVMSLTATFVYHRAKLVDWKIVLLLEPFTILGAFIAGYFSDFFPIKTLKIIFSCVALLSAVLMLRTPKKRIIDSNKKRFGFIHRKKDGDEYHINLWAGIPLAFIAGYISVLLGIGGGFAKVPMMTLVFGVSTSVAVATSAAMIVITALTGLYGYAAAGHVNINLSLILAVAVFLGGLVGSKISVKADRRFISIIFSIILVIIAVWMILS